MFEFAINLGDPVEDSISKFSGVVTARCQHLTGCNTYGVSATHVSHSTGGVMDQQWFDESRLTVIKGTPQFDVVNNRNVGSMGNPPSKT